MINTKQTAGLLATIALITAFSFSIGTPALAHIIPETCSGSGLNIALYLSDSEAHVGDTISFSVDVFNGLASGPIVCDASNIEASLTTPDGQVHPISLTRTSLSNAQVDTYNNVVTYIARAEDAQADGALVVTARTAGDIHQNDSDSRGGGNQELNVKLLPAPIVVTPTTPTPTPTPTPKPRRSSRHHRPITAAVIEAVETPTPTTVPTVVPVIVESFPNAGFGPEEAATIPLVAGILMLISIPLVVSVRKSAF